MLQCGGDEGCDGLAVDLGMWDWECRDGPGWTEGGGRREGHREWGG